jgi:hypothetical protein
MEGRFDPCTICNRTPSYQTSLGVYACDAHYQAVETEGRRRQQAYDQQQERERESQSSARYNQLMQNIKANQKNFIRQEVESYEKYDNNGVIKIPPYPQQSPWEDRDDYLDKMDDWASSSYLAKIDNKLIKQAYTVLNNKNSTRNEIESVLEEFEKHHNFSRLAPKGLYDKLVNELTSKRDTQLKRQQDEKLKAQRASSRAQDEKLRVERGQSAQAPSQEWRSSSTQNKSNEEEDLVNAKNRIKKLYSRIDNDSIKGSTDRNITDAVSIANSLKPTFVKYKQMDTFNNMMGDLIQKLRDRTNRIAK